MARILLHFFRFNLYLAAFLHNCPAVCEHKHWAGPFHQLFSVHLRLHSWCFLLRFLFHGNICTCIEAITNRKSERWKADFDGQQKHNSCCVGVCIWCLLSYFSFLWLNLYFLFWAGSQWTLYLYSLRWYYIISNLSQLALIWFLTHWWHLGWLLFGDIYGRSFVTVSPTFQLASRKSFPVPFRHDISKRCSSYATWSFGKCYVHYIACKDWRSGFSNGAIIRWQFEQFIKCVGK